MDRIPPQGHVDGPTYAQALAGLATRLGDLSARPIDELAALAQQCRRLQRTCGAGLVGDLARVAEQAEYLLLGEEPPDAARDFPFGCPP